MAANLLAVPPAEIGLPAIAAYEVWVGVLGSRNAPDRTARYEAFLSTVRLLPFDGEAGRRAAELRLRLERKGERIGPMDILIAATALVAGATLVTRNLGEFARVPDLRVVNWHD